VIENWGTILSIDELLIFDKDTDGDGVCDDARYFYAQQANWNVVAVASSDGTTVEKVKYDPYGEATVTVQQGQSASGNPYLFQGRRWDEEVDLYYFRNRVYDPALGRFVQRDPVEYLETLNLYQFGVSNALFFLDPLGFYGEDVHFYMTYYLARSCGLGGAGGRFRPGRPVVMSEAYVIAWADQFTDIHPETNPWNPKAGELYHFRGSPPLEYKDLTGEPLVPKSAKFRVVHDSPTVRRPMTIALRSKDLMKYGVALHAFQDSWSHESYTDFPGHVYDGYAPDEPFRRLEHSMEMAKRTYDMLQQMMARRHGTPCGTKWSKIGPVIREGLQATGSESERVKVWQRIIKREFGNVLSGELPPKYRKKRDPWERDFLEAARKVGVRPYY